MGRTYRRRKRKISRKFSSNLGSSSCFIKLTQWMKKHEWSPTCSLFPVDFYDTGRGLMTERGISKNQVIMSIPVELLITVSTVENSSIGWLFCEDVGVKLLAQQVLAAFLVWEKHLDSFSHWEPYLNSVPSEYTVPLFCSDEELDLIPFFVLEPVLIQKHKVFETFNDLRRILNSHNWMCSHCGTSLSSVFKFEHYLWAWCTVNTRCVYLNEQVPLQNIKIQDVNCLALAPYLDMFNHSNDAEVQVMLNKTKTCYEIHTLKPFTKFGQVFINYGYHSNLKLCTEYGFILPFNPHDCIPFLFDEILTSVKHRFPEQFNCSSVKMDLIHVHDLTKNLSCNFEGLSFNLKSLIYILSTNESKKYMLTQKIYSQDFTSAEIEVISTAGMQLISDQILKYNNIFRMLEEKKSKGCSKSFNVVTDLILEYINMLRTAESSII